MKQLLMFALTILFAAFLGCSDDASVTSPQDGGLGVGNGGGTGGGNGSVTIAISSQLDQQGGGVFLGTPSVAIKVTKITVSVAAEQYTESLQYDGTTVVSANVATPFISYNPGSGIATGQQWTFQIEGTLASNNQAYNVTSNYTIP